MSKTHIFRQRLHTPLCLIAAAGCALAISAAAPARAQPAYDAERPSDVGDIVVRAPNLGRSPTGAPYELVSASRVVRYGDLDLRTDWGVNTLKARITHAANAACRELDAAYPISAPDDPPCVSTAVRDAMYRVPIVYNHGDYRRW